MGALRRDNSKEETGSPDEEIIFLLLMAADEPMQEFAPTLLSPSRVDVLQ
jgi:hypothetical protein